MSLLALLSSDQVTPSPPPTDPYPSGPIGNPEGDLVLLTQGAGQNKSSNPPPAGGTYMRPDRAFRWFFPGEDVVVSWLFGEDVSGWTLRDYEGALVDSGSGPISSPFNLGPLPIGWYKLYLHRAVDIGLPWGEASGEALITVSRTGYGLQDTPVPLSGLEGVSHSSGVNPASHAYVGHGGYRVDAILYENDAAAWRAELDKALAKVAECQAFDPDEPGQERVLFAHFVYGTGGVTPTPQAQAQLTTSIQELVAAGVTWFEGENEPQGKPAATVAAEYQAFHAMAHAAHPSAKVMGPCPVTITGPPDAQDKLTWMREFLEAGGGNYIDGLSFHPYNAVNNNLNKGRYDYGNLVELLTDFGVDHLPRFMTEYGTFATVYGSYEPRWQAQAVMLDYHLLWQVAGVHRNNTSYFYDQSHGFWNYPSGMFTNSAEVRSAHPLALMFRTWVEETWGMELTEALDFGAVENRHYVGSRFTDADGKGALTFQSSGRFGTIRISVAGAAGLTLVDHFGNDSWIPAVGGVVEVPIAPEPGHIRIPVGVTVSLLPTDYGVDVTPRGAMRVDALTGGSGPARAVDGNIFTQYSASPGDTGPSWWRMRFDSPTTFDAVEVICPVPWQTSGSLLDFDIHALIDGHWQVIHSEQVATPSFVWTSHAWSGGTWVDSFWDRRRIFVARLAEPITATALRVYARDFSFGGGATLDQARTLQVLDGSGKGTIIGQAGRKRMDLQEVALYLSP